jgi:hypothetical protein
MMRSSNSDGCALRDPGFERRPFAVVADQSELEQLAVALVDQTVGEPAGAFGEQVFASSGLVHSEKSQATFGYATAMFKIEWDALQTTTELRCPFACGGRFRVQGSSSEDSRGRHKQAIVQQHERRGKVRRYTFERKEGQMLCVIATALGVGVRWGWRLQRSPPGIATAPRWRS